MASAAKFLRAKSADRRRCQKIPLRNPPWLNWKWHRGSTQVAMMVSLSATKSWFRSAKDRAVGSIRRPTLPAPRAQTRLSLLAFAPLNFYMRLGDGPSYENRKI